jgi:phosphatidylserine/phosphatidylglycerophosphate/cardiolipin synthase-like enzyme
MPLFVPNTNVWRVERANRFAVLIDGAAFFAAVRQAPLKAQRSIFVLGWDLDSRTRLVGESGQPEDRYPAELAEFLSALVKERPALNVYLLLWDYSLLYAAEREPERCGGFFDAIRAKGYSGWIFPLSSPAQKPNRSTPTADVVPQFSGWSSSNAFLAARSARE